MRRVGGIAVTVMIGRKPLAGECRLLGPDGSVIFRGDFSHAMEQYVPDSVARTHRT
jgi:hypothetical protein